MAYYVLICRDKPDSLQVRLDTRGNHLAYLQALDEKGILKIAGPMMGADEKPCGSLIIMQADDRATIEAIAADDPYAKAGLFTEVDIKPYNWVFNAPEG